MTAVLASRLELEADTILEGIGDEARREHASRVLLSTIETLADHESRRPVADALDEVVRTMEQVRARLDQAEEPPTGLAAALGSIDARTWVGIILGIAAALGAATGLDVADIVPEGTP